MTPRVPSPDRFARGQYIEILDQISDGTYTDSAYRIQILEWDMTPRVLDIDAGEFGKAGVR